MLSDVWVSCIVDVWSHIMFALEHLLLIICNLVNISCCADQRRFGCFRHIHHKYVQVSAVTEYKLTHC